MMREVLALTIQQTIGFLIAGAVIVLFFLGLAYVSRERRRVRRAESPDIPAAMRPGPVDAELEKPRLEKLQGWALASFLFLAVWIPVVWLVEPSTNKDQEAALTSQSIARGAKEIP